MKYSNVFRVDKSFRGYHVHVRRGGKTHSVYVSDKQAGGRRAALRKALRVKRQLESELPPRLYIRLRTKNSTRVPGVTRIVGVTRQGRRGVPRYQAFWIDAARRRRTRAFSISVYGEGGAFVRAMEARRRGVLEAMRAAVLKLGRGRVPEDLPGLSEPLLVGRARSRNRPPRHRQ